MPTCRHASWRLPNRHHSVLKQTTCCQFIRFDGSDRPDPMACYNASDSDYRSESAYTANEIMYESKKGRSRHPGYLINIPRATLG
jgi:hypothetical protein